MSTPPGDALVGAVSAERIAILARLCKPAEGLVAGQVGTVVEVLAPGVFEVEFLDSQGRTVGLAELKRAEPLALKHEPTVAA